MCLSSSLKRLLLAGDQTLALEFLPNKIRLTFSVTYGILETAYLPTLSMPMVLYMPGPGTDSFLAISAGSDHQIVRRNSDGQALTIHILYARLERVLQGISADAHILVRVVARTWHDLMGFRTFGTGHVLVLMVLTGGLPLEGCRQMILSDRGALSVEASL